MTTTILSHPTLGVFSGLMGADKATTALLPGRSRHMDFLLHHLTANFRDKVFAIAREDQHRVLFWGIQGVIRGVLTPLWKPRGQPAVGGAA